MQDTLERISLIFRDVFDDDSLVLRQDMVAADVESWDSLNHVDLIFAIEQEFKIKFTTAEVKSFQNVGHLAALIDKKRGL